jgi:hypothetical protein
MIDLDIPPTSDSAGAALALFTHTTAAHIVGLPNTPMWFLKSTPPDEKSFSLDPLGYGPYSSIAYHWAPSDIPAHLIQEFYDGWVSVWKARRTTKWGELEFDPTPKLPDEPYFLVLGQTLCDATVTEMWFGNYAAALVSMVTALSAVTTSPIVVKLHPYTDGFAGYDAKCRPIPVKSRAHTTAVIDAIRRRCPDNRVSIISGVVGLDEVLERSKCVALCNSGAGIEAMLYRKPIISWGRPEYHWATFDLRHLCDLRRAVNIESWFDPNLSDLYAYWYVMRYCIRDQPSALQRVAELLGISSAGS